ncbi:phosphatase PAP2 family protein [Billgrantia montanilacus]|uniref:phosphatase PAP2 family protein n=1 Tax=Billgrantia montanilacus TaxID=2282305 RepID=UPI0030ECD32F
MSCSGTCAFPSNHATIMLTMAFSLLLHAETRRIGHYLLLLAVPVAWARVFLGVHFPRTCSVPAGRGNGTAGGGQLQLVDINLLSSCSETALAPALCAADRTRLGTALSPMRAWRHPGLLNGNRLGQVTRLVDVSAL